MSAEATSIHAAAAEDVKLPTEPTSDDTKATDTQSAETQTDESEGEGGFDPSEFETSFGMPAGSLSSATNADEALQAIRDYTDKTLVAGLNTSEQGAEGNQGGGGEKPAKSAADIDPTATSGKKEGGESELEQLRAKVSKLEQTFQQQEQARTQEQMKEVDRRIMSEIDKWASPTYGTSKSRNYNQSKAFKELCGLMRTHVAGCQQTGEPIPVVEAVLNRVRAFHDDKFTPSQGNGKAAEAVGTPGTSKGAAAKSDDAPTNIHEALRKNWG